MSAEEIIRAWKSEDGEEKDEAAPVNPVGEELSDKDLEEVEGGFEIGPKLPGSIYPNFCSCGKSSC